MARVWIQNRRSTVVEEPDGVFRTECSNGDASIGIVAFGTVLGATVALGFTSVSVFAALRIPQLLLLVGPAAIGATALAVVFARELFTRLRRMGAFLIDATNGTLARPEAPEIHARVSSIRTSTRFAPSVSDPALSWWIIVDVEHGPSFRIARAAWGDVLPLLERLHDLGAPVATSATDRALLATAQCSVSRLGPGQIEFSCKETIARIIGPIIVAFWTLFGSGFAYLFFSGPTEGRLCVAPFVLFFAIGIAIGVMNTVTFYRRSGVFVVDAANWAISRNGSTIARGDEVRRFATGNPTPLGIRKGAVFGPQVLALELSNGRRFHLFRGLPGDVRFAADVLRREGIPVEDV